MSLCQSTITFVDTNSHLTGHCKVEEAAKEVKVHADLLEKDSIDLQKAHKLQMYLQNSIANNRLLNYSGLPLLPPTKQIVWQVNAKT